MCGLDETDVMEAMLSPNRYRAEEGDLPKTRGGALELRQLPYAVVRMDTE